MLIRNQCLKILLVEDDLAAPTTIEDFLGSLPHARSSIGPYVTLSCGSATAIPSAQESPDTLILGADSALYQAKTQGKNRICHASSNSESSPIFM